ncbi:hypothetical protein ACSSS7_003867 [Eimeria intestinalis]
MEGECESEQHSGCYAKLRKWVKSMMPRSDLPGAQQPTPWGVNRYVVLLVYIFYVFLTGCVYFGWASLAAMLLRAESFSELCERDANGKFVIDMRPEEPHICNEQEAAVQHLYTITLAVHTTMSSVAGTSMDAAGPLFTAVLGQIFNFIGWAMLASSGSVGSTALYVGFVFIGMGADMGFLPTLCITRLFPGSAGLSITVLGSAASASFAIPLILEAICKQLDLADPKYVFWWYTGLGPGLCIVLALFFIPMRGFNDFRDEQTANTGSAKKDSEPCTVCGDKDGVCTHASEPAPGDSRSAVPGVSFWKQLFSAKYIVLTLYFVGVGWASSFYQEAHNRLLSETVRHFLKILLPLSFIPCIIWGYLADKWGIIRVLFVTNASGLLMYVFTFGSVEALGYLSVICFTNYMSLFTSQVFVYIEQHFTYEHFGKLIGIIQMVGGLFSLACNPLYSEVALNPNINNGLRIVQFIMVGLLLLQFVWIITLVFLGNHDKTPAQLRAKQSGDEVGLTELEFVAEQQEAAQKHEDSMA